MHIVFIIRLFNKALQLETIFLATARYTYKIDEGEN
jgi:hypothetical protein